MNAGLGKRLDKTRVVPHYVPAGDRYPTVIVSTRRIQEELLRPPQAQTLDQPEDLHWSGWSVAFLSHQPQRTFADTVSG